MSVAYSGDKITFADGSTLGSAWTGFKNRIINGAMVIDQKNAGASVTPVDNAYTLDRWKSKLSQSSKYSVQRSTTVPAGFVNSLAVTSLSAYSITSSDRFGLQYPIEGLNCSDLDFGKSTAKSMTLSFWVRSSLTGTFGGAFFNDGANRSYPFTYTISAANTWEQKTVTFTGDTTGTWKTDNTVGLYIEFSLGTGSTLSGTAGSWASGFYPSATGATSLVGTNGATFYITGVQLEKGSTATSFDYRPYGTELQLCQRYFEKSYNADVVPATSTEVGQKYSAGHQGSTTTAVVVDSLSYKVTKRATPTLVIYDYDGNSGKCRRESYGVTSTTNSAVTVAAEGMNNCIVFSSGTASANGIAYHYTISAEL